MTEYTPTTAEIRRAYALEDDEIGHPVIAEDQLAAFDRWLAAHDAEVRAEALAKVTDDGLWGEVLRLRGQIEEARNAWWSATEQGDNGLVYTDRIEDAMDDIWSAIGHVDWTPDHTEEAS